MTIAELLREEKGYLEPLKRGRDKEWSVIKYDSQSLEEFFGDLLPAGRALLYRNVARRIEKVEPAKAELLRNLASIYF